MKKIFCIFTVLLVCYGVYAQKDYIRADYSVTLNGGKPEVTFSGFAADGLWSGLNMATSNGVDGQENGQTTLFLQFQFAFWRVG